MNATPLNAQWPTDPHELRPLLHQELERLPDSALESVRVLLLEIELAEVTATLDDAADAARAAGHMTPESIAAAVAAHRAAHPYRRA